MPFNLPSRASLLQSTWSPFQSPEVREICAHLTPAEHARLLTDAGQRGANIALWFALPFAMMVASFRLSSLGGLVLLSVFAVYFAVFAWPRLRAMRWRTKELLCAADWARERGYARAPAIHAFPLGELNDRRRPDASTVRRALPSLMSKQKPEHPASHPTEREIDESIEESFPASDPPALHVEERPTSAGGAPKPDATRERRTSNVDERR